MANITDTSQLDHTHEGARTNGKAVEGMEPGGRNDPLAKVLEWAGARLTRYSSASTQYCALRSTVSLLRGRRGCASASLSSRRPT